MAIRNSLDGLNCGLDTAEEQKVNWKIDLKKLPRREGQRDRRYKRKAKVPGKKNN